MTVTLDDHDMNEPYGMNNCLESTCVIRWSFVWTVINVLDNILDETITLFFRMTVYVDESYVWTTIMPWMVDYGLMVEIGNVFLF